MFVVVFQQVCTELGRDFGPLLFADPLQILKVPRLSLGNSKLHGISMGFRSGDWLGHSRTVICFFLSHSFYTVT